MVIVKPDNIATFLGRKLNGNYQDEMNNLTSLGKHVVATAIKLKHLVIIPQLAMTYPS